MENNLLKRIVSSVALVALCYLAIVVPQLFFIVILAVTVLGLYEFFTMLEKKGISIFKYVGIGMGAMIPLSIMFRFEPTRKWELFFIVAALLILMMMQFQRRQNSGVIVGISTTIFGILYVSWFFSFLIKIRQLDNGMGMVIALLAITKGGDIGAYLVGMRYGKTPFIPRISPKKTVEGAVGGLLFSIAGAWICKPFFAETYSFLHLAALGAVIGALAQLGDLSESLMKRDCGIKDSAAVIPGIGGVLDLIDSLLFTAPVFYFYIALKTFSF